MIFAFTVLLLSVKFFGLFVGFYVTGSGFQHSLVGSLSMLHISEISLLLSSKAQHLGVMTRMTYLLLLASTVSSIIFSPIITKLTDGYCGHSSSRENDRNQNVELV